MKLKKLELIDLFKVLKTNNNTDSIKFNYWVNKNLRLIKDEIESIIEIEKNSLLIISEFEKEKRSLFKEHGTESLGEIKVDASDELFVKRMKELEEKFKVELEKYSNNEKEIRSILEEEVEYKFHKIPYEALPSKLNNVEKINSLELLMMLEIVE